LGYSAVDPENRAGMVAALMSLVAAHERGTLEAVVKARQTAMASSGVDPTNAMPA